MLVAMAAIAALIYPQHLIDLITSFAFISNYHNAHRAFRSQLELFPPPSVFPSVAIPTRCKDRCIAQMLVHSRPGGTPSLPGFRFLITGNLKQAQQFWECDDHSAGQRKLESSPN